MKRKISIAVSLLLTVSLLSGCGNNSSGQSSQTRNQPAETQQSQSPGNVSGQTAATTAAATAATTAAQKEVNIIPSQSASVEYETYTDESGYFSLEIPKGWSVAVGMPPNYDVDLISYAITVFDPQNTDRRLYFNFLTAGMLKSQEARDWYNKNYPGTLGEYPAATEVSTAGFFSGIGEYYGYKDFMVTENIGETALGGDLLNATEVSSSTGKTVQGLFAAKVTADSYPVLRNMFDASQGSIDVGSLTFTDTFQTERQSQWKSVLSTASYLFQTANEISDMIMDSWESRNKTYDVISQKQSDATPGYDRVLDTETGEYYRADAGFGDVFDSQRYVVVDDDAAYLTPPAGWIEWKEQRGY